MGCRRRTEGELQTQILGIFNPRSGAYLPSVWRQKFAAAQKELEGKGTGRRQIGNPSYPAGIHFLNAERTKNPSLQHRKVIGLQNLDSESEAYRPYKQLIERLNRTFKHHVKPSHGFNSGNGALALTTLFVTHYNFLRPHMSLNYQTPVALPELEGIATLQGKWTKILSLAA